jgi:hypothetical protein
MLSAWSDQAVPVDLPALYQSLGIRWDGKEVTLTDDAPLSALRRALVAPAALPAPLVPAPLVQ